MFLVLSYTPISIFSLGWLSLSGSWLLPALQVPSVTRTTPTYWALLHSPWITKLVSPSVLRLLIPSQLLWATELLFCPETWLCFFIAIIWPNFLWKFKQVTFHTSSTSLILDHHSSLALQVHWHHVWSNLLWSLLFTSQLLFTIGRLFLPGPQVLSFRVNIWRRSLITFRRLSLFLNSLPALQAQPYMCSHILGSLSSFEPPSCFSV